jgi:hypothetical protein
MKEIRQIEFGDFQTPQKLADEVCDLLLSQDINPEIIIEPTCGVGSFITSALKKFSNLKHIIGNDISRVYVDEIKKKHAKAIADCVLELANDDFFKINWNNKTKHHKNILFLGNPPWVTNSQLGLFSGKNKPIKSNFQSFSGFEAISGKSNFDISEWMLLEMIKVLQQNDGYLAMLVKTSVARKIISSVWDNNVQANISLYFIDTLDSFKVSVDACLLLGDFNHTKIANKKIVHVYSDLKKTYLVQKIGYAQGELIADINAYRRVSGFLQHDSDETNWRSGIKHDCAKIMELKDKDGLLINGLGEKVDIEDKYLFPMLKSSDIARGNKPSRYMLVTQKKVGENTDHIKLTAPKTWQYLQKHRDYFSKRKSSIYKKGVNFAIFGVGDYSFQTWKVGVSGLYKKTTFRVVAPYRNKPVVLDDTCYFIGCESKKEAESICNALNSDVGRDIVKAMIFIDAKRPITTKFLNRINLFSLMFV